MSEWEKTPNASEPTNTEAPETNDFSESSDLPITQDLFDSLTEAEQPSEAEENDLRPSEPSAVPEKSTPSASSGEPRRSPTLSASAEAASPYAYRPHTRPTRKRLHYGLEALRIVSMLFVVLLHILGRGGIASAADQQSGAYAAAWLLLSFAYPAVDLYALISGYVGCKSTFKLSKLIYLWLSVVTVNLAVWGLFAVFAPSLAAEYSLSECLTPLCTGEYWYFTAYVGLYLLTPVLNAGIAQLSQKSYATLIGCLFAVTVLLPSVSGHDLFRMYTGYSALWLVEMYLVGGYVRMHGTHIGKRASRIGLGVYILSSVFIFVQKLVVESRLLAENAESPYYYTHYSYTSPFIVLSAVGLFVFFVHFHPKKKQTRRLLRFFSQSTFGVYLFHAQTLVWENLLTDSFAPLAELPGVVTALAAVGAAVGIFAVCTVLEKLRAFLMRMVGVEKGLKRISFLN